MLTDMIEFAVMVGIVALVATFVIALSDKWGWREWLQVNADYLVGKVIKGYDGDILNRLFSCNFCCAWWVGLALSLTLMVATGEWQCLAIPFCSTIITRNML